MDVFDTMHWRTTKKLLSVIGAWPFQPASQQKPRRVLFYSVIQSIYIVEIFKIFQVWGDLVETLNCVPVFVYFSLIQVKIANCYFNTEKAELLLLQVRSDWKSNLGNSELKILHDDGRLHKIIMDIYSSGLISVAVIWFLEPLIPIFLDIVIPLNETRQRAIPYPTEYFILSEENFYPIYLHQFLVTFMAMFVLLSYDSLYADLIQHGCSMFTIIGTRFKNLSVEENITDEEEINRGSDAKSLVICIRMHKDLLQFTELLNRDFTNYFFVLLGVIMVGLSVTGFQFVFLITEFGEKIRCLWYGVGQVIHLYFFSYFGQKLINHSELIYDSMHFLCSCHAKWYNYSKKMKTMIILALMRCRTLSVISAGKMFTISIENFSSVMKTSLSYFTVLSSAQ